MSKSTTTKQGELLSTQENVENNPNKNSTLIDQEKIEGTPFTLINFNNQWFIAIGDHRITEPTKTKEEQIKKLGTEKWQILVHLIIIVLKKMNQNPIIREMDEIQETDKKWENPRENYKNTHQQYNPIK